MRSQNPWGHGCPNVEASLQVIRRRARSLLISCAWSPLPGLRKTATRESFGTISFRSSSRFPTNSGRRVANPVTLPPGRARAGDEPASNSIATVNHDNGDRGGGVLRCGISPEPSATMTTTLRRTNSAASARWRSRLPSPDRHSMTMSFPSIYPSSCKPRRNASRDAVCADKGAVS